MKTLIVAAIRCSLMFLVPTVTYAISAQWDLDPFSGDWNTAANWTPNGVPNGSADIATFGLSNMTNVSISANTEVNGIIFTAAATNPYTITATDGFTLTISGAVITNNFTVQTFVTTGFGQIRFTNSSTASGFIKIENNGTTNFFDNSSGAGSIENNGTTNFFGRSSAGSAFLESFGAVNFFDRSSAGSAFLTCGQPSSMNFFDRSSAGSATIIAGGPTNFFDRSSAGTSTIEISFDIPTNFFDNSTAGSAMISAFGGTTISFLDSSQGGTAQIGLFEFEGSNFLDISGHNAPGLTIGSLEGEQDNFVNLGANNLTIGSNNLSTTFSGVIQDGGQNGGTGGSLTKIGTGTLILSGANTYTGDTNVNRGVLQVDGSIRSNTFVNRGGTLAGTGMINGNVTNNGGVSPGSAGAPGMLTVTGNYTQAQYAALMIQLAGANAGEFSVLNILGTANLSGRLNPTLLNGFVPAVGDSFTFLTAGSLNGTLFMFNRNIDDLPEHWEVSYFPTFAVLAVAAGNVPVPDQGSTFLLLTLGLLGLGTYRWQIARKQS